MELLELLDDERLEVLELEVRTQVLELELSEELDRELLELLLLDDELLLELISASGMSIGTISDGSPVVWATMYPLPVPASILLFSPKTKELIDSVSIAASRSSFTSMRELQLRALSIEE